MARQPRSHLADLVRAIVVHHQVDFKTAWEVRVDVVEESQKLLVPVPSVLLRALKPPWRDSQFAFPATPPIRLDMIANVLDSSVAAPLPLPVELS